MLVDDLSAEESKTNYHNYLMNTMLKALSGNILGLQMYCILAVLISLIKSSPSSFQKQY